MALTVTHALVSAIADDPVAAAAGEVVPSDWNAAHTIDPGSVTWTGTQSYTIGHTAFELVPEDPAIGTIQCRFYDTDFSGVNDPVMFLGHNAGGAPSGATRFFMGIEGHYNDTVTSHIWSEMYWHRYDSDGSTNYRPFSIGCYDAHAEVNFKADQLTFDHRSGTSAYGFGSISMSSNPYMYVKSAAKVLFGGNNQEQLQQAKSGGGYETIAYMNSSDEVSFSPNVNARMRTKLSVGSDITPTAKLHLGAGTTTAATAPLKFTSGSLMTVAEAGAVEFLTDTFYGTITTGAARRTFGMLEAAQTWTAAQTFTNKIIVSGGSASAPSVDISGGGITTGFWSSGAYNIQVVANSKKTHAFNNTVLRCYDSLENQLLAFDGQNSAIIFGQSEDVTLARTAAGSLDIKAANGKAIGIRMLTELLTIAAAATSTTTIQKPANSIILGVPVRVTTAVTCTSTFTVGDAGSATRFSTAAVSKAANTTDKGTAAGAYYNATAEGIVITPDTVPSDATGRVRVTIYYIELTPPTS